MYSLFFISIMEITALGLFLFPMYAGLPSHDFIMVTALYSSHHFYRDHIKTQEPSSVLFSLWFIKSESLPPLSHTHFWEVPQYRLPVCGGLSSWICTEALKPGLFWSIWKWLHKVKARRTVFMWGFLSHFEYVDLKFFKSVAYLVFSIA